MTPPPRKELQRFTYIHRFASGVCLVLVITPHLNKDFLVSQRWVGSGEAGNAELIDLQRHYLLSKDNHPAHLMVAHQLALSLT